MAASTRTFQSTHPLRGATPDVVRQKAKRLISIHAPLAGCDFVSACPVVPPLDFNPRTPCGVRPWTRSSSGASGEFQSTHPLRGATVRFGGQVVGAEFQSTHPLRGATASWTGTAYGSSISIHAPLAGCDLSFNLNDAIDKISIHAPLAGCDEHGREVPAFVAAISIHAPLAGCDKRDDGTGCGREHFNPRTPCGVRPDSTPSPSCSADFNPRAPCGARQQT